MKHSLFKALRVAAVLAITAILPSPLGSGVANAMPPSEDGGTRPMRTDGIAALDAVLGPMDLGNLTDYLLVYTDAGTDANWQGATKGFIGDVAVDGITASERTSGGVPYAGTLYTNDGTLDAWAGIVDQNDPAQVSPAQAFGSTGEVARINGLESDLNSAFAQNLALTATAGYSSVSSTSLNGLNTQNSVAETYVINITSGLQVSTKINITGDASDVFILRWDTDGDPSNGFQGQAKFQSGGAVVPLGGLKATNFINFAGNIGSSGGGGNPAAPYPQGPRLADGQGSLITNGADFNGGGFFTGYWLTTGDPTNGETSSLSNGIFVGGWYTSTTKFSMTSGTSGVYVSPPAEAAPTDTPTATATDTATATATNTATNTPTRTATATRTPTPSATATATSVDTATPTNTPVPTVTLTPSPEPTFGGSGGGNGGTLSLGNLIFHDFNDNGVFEPGLGEFGVSAVKVNLYVDDGDGVLDAGDGPPIDTTNSVGGGIYGFSGLLAGDYIVQIDGSNFLAGGFLAGLGTSRGNEVLGMAPDPDNDVNSDDNGYNVAGFGVASKAITLIDGTEPINDGDNNVDTNLSLDFGFYTPLCVGNQIFADLDNDGIYEPGSGETGIDGVALTLFRDTDNSGTLTGADTALATANTAGGGLYNFCDLAAGNYLVRVDAANFGAGQPLAGQVSSLFNAAAPDPDDDVDNDDNGAPVVGGAVSSRAVTLTAGGEPDKPDDGDGVNSNLTVDMGFFTPAPAITLDKTASATGSCPGSQTLQVAPGTLVTYCYKVTNSGDTHLTNIVVNDNLLGFICSIAGPLAPGAMQTCTSAATIDVDTTNVGDVSGTPSDSAGVPLPGLPPVTDTDDAVVDVLTPDIDVQKTVYLGHTAGAGCGTAGELVSGTTGTNITYCFKVTNTGQAALGSLVLTDATLGINQTNMTLLSGTAPLAPGAMAVYYFQTVLSVDRINTVTASGTPLDGGGNPLPGATPPTDTDTAAVDVVSPAVVVDKTASANGVCPGSQTLQVAPGTTVTYCYKVTNTGDTSLVNLQVTDNLLGAVCTIAGPMAPGGMQTCTKVTTVNVDTTNIGAVTGTPSDPAGTPLPGVPPVTDDDDAVVDVLTPAIDVQKTVYLGHTAGAGCAAAGELASGNAGAAVTYCFKVTNTGQATLDSLTLVDATLGIDQTDMTLLSGTQPLAPGAMAVFYYQTTITADLINTVTASGTPLNGAGSPLPGATPPVDTDTAQVTLLATVCVGDTVFFDLNNNGIFEPGSGEFGLAGVAVTVLADTDSTGTLTPGDTPVGSVVTGIDGAFRICNLPPGDYIVRLDQSNFDPGGALEGLSSSSGNDIAGMAPDPDNDLNNDDNGNPVPGQGVATKAVTLAAGTEPGVGVDGDGTNSNGTVDLGLIRPQNPTGVRLLSLRAETRPDGGVAIDWRSGQEADVLGYHVYRSPSPTGAWERVTERLLPAVDGPGEHSYQLTDRQLPGTTTYYRLEVVGTDGRTEHYGPLLAGPRALRSIFLPAVFAQR